MNEGNIKNFYKISSCIGRGKSNRAHEGLATIKF